MAKASSLVTLCADSLRDQLLQGDNIVEDICELPSELFDCVVSRLPPLGLHRLQIHMTDVLYGSYERKRKRELDFETRWKALYMSRWPEVGWQDHGVGWVVRGCKPKREPTVIWRQFYWETHLQKYGRLTRFIHDCLDAAAEVAVLPSYEGCIGDIEVSDSVLEYVGGKGDTIESMKDYKKISDHFRDFGSYARCLRLPSVLYVAEICDLLKTCLLETLELRWIKSEEHVQGLCRLLRQNNRGLTSIKFIHCKLSPSFVNTICDSLFIEGLQTHVIQNFSIKTSSVVEKSASSIPGLVSFLSSGRSLSSLCLCDTELQPHLARMVLDTLLDDSSSITVLDLSENNISGWLNRFKSRHSASKELSSDIGNSLKSLRVLNLRNTMLQKHDADCLACALLHMPNIETIDLSDNLIGDDGLMSLIHLFIDMSERDFHLIDLNVESCELTCKGVTRLLEVLSTFRKPLNSLSIGGNELGRELGVPLAKFLCTGITSLDVADIGLGPSGFSEALDGMTEKLKVVNINISKNRGGIEAARFFSKLLELSPELFSVDASYNFMSVEALPFILSGLKSAKENVESVNLTGNSLGDASVFSEFQVNGKSTVELPPSLSVLNVPYDDDP